MVNVVGYTTCVVMMEIQILKFFFCFREKKTEKLINETFLVERKIGSWQFVVVLFYSKFKKTLFLPKIRLQLDFFFESNEKKTVKSQQPKKRGE